MIGSENKEKPTFEIGRWDSRRFEPYETAYNEEDAIKIFRETIERVSSPDEIRIFEAGGGSPRKDLEQRAEENNK